MPKTGTPDFSGTNLKVYQLAELEQILGVSYRTLLSYAKDGRLKAVKIGGKWLVSEDNLRRFLNGDE